jgi:hypothetical protein
MDEIRQTLAEFFKAAAQQPFAFEIKTAPLRDVEALWNVAEHGTRIVFQP